MFLSRNDASKEHTFARFGLARISVSLFLFLSAFLGSPVDTRRFELATASALFFLWGIATAIWPKMNNPALQMEKCTAFVDLVFCGLMLLVFHILPMNVVPAIFLLPTLELTSLYGVAGSIFAITAFAWMAMLTGLVSASFIQQPLWWVLVLLWTALIILVATVQMVYVYHPYRLPLFDRLHKRALTGPSLPEVLQKAELAVKNAGDSLPLMAPQIIAAFELPFQHMGVRTQEYRKDIEGAVRALYCAPNFDKQALSDCLQVLLLAAKQNWTGLAAFSPREREILELLPQNISYKEMSCRLHVSTSTIKTHIYHIFQKLDISNREEAISLIRERGWFLIQEHSERRLTSQ
jgi:DNA-binding CsgD family transcriptional regulator